MKVDLHTWKKDYIPLLVVQANNAKLAATMQDSFPCPYTLADAEYWIHSNLLIDPPINFAVFAEEQFAGGAGFVLRKDIHRKSVIGWVSLFGVRELVALSSQHWSGIFFHFTMFTKSLRKCFPTIQPLCARWRKTDSFWKPL